MPYIFGKLWHLAIIWAIRKAFQCILQGVRILLAKYTRISPTSENDSYSVFLGNGRMVSNFLLSKMEEWFSNMFSSSLSYLASGQWLIMVVSLQRSFIVLLDDTFFPAAIFVKLLLKLWCFHLSLAASQMQSFRQHCTTPLFFLDRIGGLRNI